MTERLQQQVEHCYRQAEAFFQQRFPRPEISFKLRGQKAGVAHLTENRLRFNPALYQDNREDFLRQTVPHEVAHMIAHHVYGPHIQPHGEEWQLIMRGVYELPPLRCHDYAVERRKGRRFIYLCDCPQGDNEFPFTSQRHALVRKGRRYICRRCKGNLRFSGEERLG